MSPRALIIMDLRNAVTNRDAWRRQAPGGFRDARLRFWENEIDRLLGKLSACAHRDVG